MVSYQLSITDETIERAAREIKRQEEVLLEVDEKSYASPLGSPIISSTIIKIDTGY
jgi:hypothetical protein